MRPDKENWDTLQAHGKRISFGEGEYKIKWHDGYMISWKAVKVEEGHQAPLKKEDDE